MAASNSDRVTCPACNKTYRWQAALVGKTVVCKQCDIQLTIPDQPGVALAVSHKPKPDPKPVEDDGLYELAANPDDEPPLPPPAAPAARPDTAYEPPEPAVNPDPSVTNEEADSSEPVVHVSEAAKAARREELRIAAAAEESIRTWRDFKWLYILLGLLCLFLVIYWAMYAFSDAVDEGLHKTMLDDRAVPHVSSVVTPPADSA